MCISLDRAELTQTRIMTIVLSNGRHFTAYSNRAVNLSGKPNAMVLPIPGKTSPGMFHDTTSYSDFLKEAANRSDLHHYTGMRSKSLSRSLGSTLSFDDFRVGAYRVGLSESIEGAQAFLNSLPESERPSISPELLSFFGERYPGWSFAVCVFPSGFSAETQPIAYEYEPLDRDRVFFPTMDSHDGGAPDLDEEVMMDHTFVYEHLGIMPEDMFQKSLVLTTPNTPEFLKERRYRNIVRRGKESNGDCTIDLREMRETDFIDTPVLLRSGKSTVSLV